MEKSKVPADDITHKSVAALLIISYVHLRGGKREKKTRNEDFDSHYRYVSANETIRALSIGTLMEVRLYPTRKNARGRSPRTKGDKKRCRLIVGRDHHKAREPIIIITPVNPGSSVARC